MTNQNDDKEPTTKRGDPETPAKDENVARDHDGDFKEYEPPRNTNPRNEKN